MVAIKRFFSSSLYAVSKANFYMLGAIVFIALGEVHTLWVGDYSEVDWFLALDYKLYKQWAIKDIGNMGQLVVITGMLYSAIPKRSSFKQVSLALFLYAIIDMCLYFVTMKTGFYGVYFVLGIILLTFTYRITKRKSE